MSFASWLSEKKGMRREKIKYTVIKEMKDKEKIRKNKNK
jgi:hypothetical protein